MVGLAGELVKGGKFICSVFKVWTCPIILRHQVSATYLFITALFLVCNTR